VHVDGLDHLQECQLCSVLVCDRIWDPSPSGKHNVCGTDMRFILLATLDKDCFVNYSGVQYVFNVFYIPVQYRTNIYFYLCPQIFVFINCNFLPSSTRARPIYFKLCMHIGQISFTKYLQFL